MNVSWIITTVVLSKACRISVTYRIQDHLFASFILDVRVITLAKRAFVGRNVP